jgi:hypothetical protein
LERPLSDLHIGDHVQATVTGNHPWGFTAHIEGYEPVGASLDLILHASHSGLQELTENRPAIGTVLELVVGELRPWHHEPWVWVRLTYPEQT